MNAFAGGIDITQQPIPVVPLRPHFMCGGVTTNFEGRTTIPGLWAIGECACTGLRMAPEDRLAEQLALLEGLVFAPPCGRGAAGRGPHQAVAGRPRVGGRGLGYLERRGASSSPRTGTRSNRRLDVELRRHRPVRRRACAERRRALPCLQEEIADVLLEVLRHAGPARAPQHRNCVAQLIVEVRREPPREPGAALHERLPCRSPTRSSRARHRRQARRPGPLAVACDPVPESQRPPQPPARPMTPLVARAVVPSRSRCSTNLRRRGHRVREARRRDAISSTSPRAGCSRRRFVVFVDGALARAGRVAPCHVARTFVPIAPLRAPLALGGGRAGSSFSSSDAVGRRVIMRRWPVQDGGRQRACGEDRLGLDLPAPALRRVQVAGRRTGDLRALLPWASLYPAAFGRRPRPRQSAPSCATRGLATPCSHADPRQEIPPTFVLGFEFSGVALREHRNGRGGRSLAQLRLRRRRGDPHPARARC